MLVVKMKLLTEALKDPDFKAKWLKMKTMKDVEDLLRELCKKHGIEVEEVQL